MIALSPKGDGLCSGNSRPKLTTNSRRAALSCYLGSANGSKRDAIWRSACIAYNASLVPSATTGMRKVAQKLELIQGLTLLPHRACQQVVHLVHDHQPRRILVEQAERQDFEVRTSACVRRFVPEAVNDLCVQPTVVGLGRHLQTKNLPCLDFAELVADVSPRSP